MAKKLGRGLSHLIPTSSSGTGSAEILEHPDYRELLVTEIRPNKDQPRKKFNERELEELSKTLLTVGLIEPIVVRKVDEGYEIISGERRWRACQKAGFVKIPSIIKRLNDTQAIEMAIIENIQREELTPIEEARAYELLMEKTGAKTSQIADKVGKDRTTVANLLRLLKLPEEILQMLEDGVMNSGQARPLLGIGDKATLIRTARKIISEGWTARKVEDEVAKLTSSSIEGTTVGKKSAANSDANSRSLEEKIRKKYMAKINVQHTKKGSGKISIHYGTLDDLERILVLMGIK